MMSSEIERLESRQLLSGLGFSAANSISVGANPVAVLSADVNGDGIPDLIVAKANGKKVGVMLGNGNGTFEPEMNFTVGNNPVALAVGQFNPTTNGNGNIDIVAALGSAGRISVINGNGDGTFGSPHKYDVGSDPVAVAVARFAGSEYSDIVAVNEGSGTVSVLLGNFGGTFEPQTQFAAGNEPVAIAEANLEGENGSGLPDLIIANKGSNSVSVLKNQGGGTFAAPVNYTVGNAPSSVAVADVNGDSNFDIVTANSADNTVSVLLGNGDGTFGRQQVFAAGNEPVSVATGDIDGDTKTDIVVADQSDNSVGVLLGNGDGTFKAPVEFPAGTSPSSAIVTDLNNDGGPDIAAVNSSAGTVTTLINTANVPTASETNGVVTASGSGSGDTVRMHTKGAKLILNDNSLRTVFPLATTTSIHFTGGDGNDSIAITAGVPSVIANTGPGKDTIQAQNSAQDTLQGGPGADLLIGEAGDSLIGGGGADTLLASSGSPTLRGGSGANSLQGSTGSPLLIAGSSNDTLVGGSGFGTIEYLVGDTVFPGNYNVNLES